MVLKDYIDYYPMNDEHFQYGYIQTKNNTKFLVRATMPQLKEQFFVDYPEIKILEIEFHVYLLPDRNFQLKFQRCGNGAILDETYQHRSEMIRIETQRNAKQTIDIFFDQEALKTFEVSEYLTLFTQLRISFLKDSLLEDEITIQKSWTEIPFFMVVFQNEHLSFWNFLVQKAQSLQVLRTQLICIVGLALFLLLLYCRYKRRASQIKTVIKEAK